jgi:hypothetical protein
MSSRCRAEEEIWKLMASRYMYKQPLRGTEKEILRVFDKALHAEAYMWNVNVLKRKMRHIPCLFYEATSANRQLHVHRYCPRKKVCLF